MWSLIIQLLSRLIDLIFWCLQQLIGWLARYPFYACGGLVVANLAPLTMPEVEVFTAFMLGVGISIGWDWGLQCQKMVYRQIVFVAVGLAAGFFLNRGLLPPLILAGLCLLQARYS